MEIFCAWCKRNRPQNEFRLKVPQRTLNYDGRRVLYATHLVKGCKRDTIVPHSVKMAAEIAGSRQ